MYDVLPSPANLRAWGLLQEESCFWCGGRGTTQHALGVCSVALAAGRYRWRHDQVLAVVVEIVQQEVIRPRKRSTEDEEEAHEREVVCKRGPGGKRWKEEDVEGKRAAKCM